MAEFQDVMKDWRRMCKAQDAIDNTDPCRACRLANNGNDCGGIYEDNEGKDTRDYAHIEKTVTAWAAEHPVVYPTWGEWFLTTCQVPLTSDLRHNDWETLLASHIPADTAQKLGIEPK